MRVVTSERLRTSDTHTPISHVSSCLISKSSRNSACAYQSPESYGRPSDNFGLGIDAEPFTAGNVLTSGENGETTLQAGDLASDSEKCSYGIQTLCSQIIKNNPPVGMAPICRCAAEQLEVKRVLEHVCSPD